MTKKSASKKSVKHSGKGRQSMKTLDVFNKTRFLVFAVAFAIVTVLIILQANAAPNKRSTSGVRLYVTPSTLKVSSGKPLSLQIWVDAKSKPVNAVQANLLYPTDKFTFNNINATGSAFEIEAQSSSSNGTITVARGHVGSITGVQLVATVNLIATASSGKASVVFSSGTAVVSSTTNTNILDSTSGGQFTLASFYGSGLFTRQAVHQFLKQ